MGMTQPASEQRIAELQSRIDELEARNRELAGASAATRAPDEAPGQRWRAALAAVLIGLGAVLAPLGLVTTWAGSTITSTDGFVATYAPVIHDPDVQAYVRDQVVSSIDARLGIDELVSDLVGGLQEVVSGRPRAAAALGLLAQPAADGVRSAIIRATDRVVTSEEFATTWEQALRFSHTQLVGALGGDPTVMTTLTEDGLGLRLGPIVDRVRTALVDQGFALAARIPDVNRTIVVVHNVELLQVQGWYRFATAVGPWLPWLSVALLVAGVLVARRRRAAMTAAAVGLAVVGGLLMAGLAVARAALPTLVPATVMPAGVADTFYETITSTLSDAALATFVVGVVVAVLGWWRGPSRTATRLRAGWQQAAEAVRRSRDAHGLGTGRFGEWLRARRGWVVAAVTVAAVAVLVANRPLSPAEIIVTALVAVVALGVSELLEAPHGAPQDEAAPPAD